jgi:hypothetical protein
MNKRIKDISGNIYGRLRVLKYMYQNKRKDAVWLCVCECGIEKEISGRTLREGKSNSCGCLHRERVSESSKTHGLKNHPIYSVWRNMKNRCNNHNKLYYGERGLKVCERWLEFINFYNDMASSYKK